MFLVVHREILNCLTVSGRSRQTNFNLTKEFERKEETSVLVETYDTTAMTLHPIEEFQQLISFRHTCIDKR